MRLLAALFAENQSEVPNSWAITIVATGGRGKDMDLSYRKPVVSYLKVSARKVVPCVFTNTWICYRIQNRTP
jgi:hypothetical protein